MDLAVDILNKLPVSASNLYSKYRDWCNESGKHTLTLTKFGRELNKMEGFVQKDVKADGNYYTIKESGEINHLLLVLDTIK